MVYDAATGNYVQQQLDTMTPVRTIQVQPQQPQARRAAAHCAADARHGL